MSEVEAKRQKIDGEAEAVNNGSGMNNYVVAKLDD